MSDNEHCMLHDTSRSDDHDDQMTPTRGQPNYFFPNQSSNQRNMRNV